MNADFIQNPSHVSTGERLATLAAILVAAGSGPLLLVAAEAGYGSFHDFGLKIVLPSVAGLALLFAWAKGRRWSRFSSGLRASFWVGILATLGLDAVREIGFRLFHSMPGDISMLMGVLLTDRFMEGSTWYSDALGELDHLWNGVTLAMVYLLLLGRQRVWMAVAYGLLVAVGFMTSSVVDAIGVGTFGRDFGPGFAVTVLLAHIMFGGLLGIGSRFTSGIGKPLWKRQQ